MLENHTKTPLGVVLLLVFLLSAVVGLGFLQFKNYNQIKLELASKQNLQTELELTQTKLTTANNEITSLQSDLQLAHNTLTETKDILNHEQNRNEEFAKQLEKITGTVETLDKLAKTDKELLQKYSKVYFLNEHYAPERLREIKDKWKYSEDHSHQLHSQVIRFFEDMMKEAEDDGIDLWVVSAYRSFEIQAELKGVYNITYGSGANTFSADQGYSEHQLGTTVDFTTNGINGSLTNAFENTDAYQWLIDNAHKYGFTLSYPRDNAYYVFEPWHWRFVGKNLARDLKREEGHFYDWDQRKIDEYLVEIFD